MDGVRHEQKMKSKNKTKEWKGAETGENQGQTEEVK